MLQFQTQNRKTLPRSLFRSSACIPSSPILKAGFKKMRAKGRIEKCVDDRKKSWLGMDEPITNEK